jgi:hypothetical protein
MPYIRKNQTIFIANDGKPIYANVNKIAFRKYWGKKKDKETGKTVPCRKSMPYALCEVQISSDLTIPLKSEFTIAGYMLRHVIMGGEKILTFDKKYVADFVDEHGNEWVRKMITEEYWKGEVTDEKP